MTATYEGALDELMTLFNVKWTADTPAVVGAIPKVYWPGIDEGTPPPTDLYWARFTQQTIDEEQSNLAGDDACRRYTLAGILFIQIFAPLSDSRAVKRARQLAVIARDTYRGVQTTSGIFLRNARMREIGSKDKWFQINVVVDYEHDDVA